MTSEGSKRRDFLSLVFITKSISKRLLIIQIKLLLLIHILEFCSGLGKKKLLLHLTLKACFAELVV